MNRRQYATALVFSISLLTVALIPLSGQQGSTYDPWLDFNGDGVINVEDLHAFGQVYGTSGTPLIQPESMKYDSDWINISNKRGQNFSITPGFNLETTTWYPRIYGKAATDTTLHQKYWYGYGMPGWTQATHGGLLANDYCQSLIQTSDGGYAIVGTTNSTTLDETNDYSNMWLIKTDSNGLVQWNRTYGGSRAEYGYSLVQTSDGGYALAGYTYSYGVGTPTTPNVYLVKTFADGTIDWQAVYGGINYDRAYSLVQTSDGGYALAGYTNSQVVTPVKFNVYLVKTDAWGTMTWNKSYGGTEDDYGYSVVETSDGGYAIGGYTVTAPLLYTNVYLVRTDGLGTMAWNKTYGGTRNDYCYSLVETSEGGYTLAGATNSYGVGTPSFYNAWLVRTDSAGNMQWNKAYGGTSDDGAYSLVETSEGGYAIAGYTKSYGVGAPSSYENFWLVKTDLSGTAQWNKTYGGIRSDQGRSVVETSEGGYAIAGYTNSYGVGAPTYSSVYLVKADMFGLTDLDLGVTITNVTADAVTFYRGKTDPYYNYIRVQIWVVKETP